MRTQTHSLSHRHSEKELLQLFTTSAQDGGMAKYAILKISSNE